MADEITPAGDIAPVVDPIIDNGEQIDAGNLPSSREELGDALSKFQINDEFAAKNFKNGKLYGRFDSLEAVLNTLHSVETKYSNVMRDIKTPVDGATTTTAPEVNLVEAVQPLVGKFADNGYNYEGMDTEIAEIAQQTGKSVAEIKLAAIEIRDQVNKAYGIVGGKEEYEGMLGWAKDNLSDTEKQGFDNSLKNGMGELAIEGLHARYKNANQGDSPAPRRIEGDGGGNVGIRPYATFAELGRDRAYLQTSAGQRDTAAKALHAKRMALTPDSTIYGR